MFPYHNKLIFHLSPHGFKYRKNLSVIYSHTGELHPTLLQDAAHFITTLQQFVNYLALHRRGHQKKGGNSKGGEGDGTSAVHEKFGLS